MTTTGPLHNYTPGVALPAALLARLADGSTYADRDAWIILWDYQPDPDQADTAELVITTGRDDHDNPGRIIPGSEPYRVTYTTGLPIRSGSLTWALDYGKRQPRQYTGMSAENTPEVMAAAMVKRATQLEDWVPERLTASAAARLAGIQPATFRAYVSRGQAPEPDGHIDGRTPYWLRATIEQWRAPVEGE